MSSDHYFHLKGFAYRSDSSLLDQGASATPSSFFIKSSLLFDKQSSQEDQHPEAQVISTTRLTIMPVLVCSASSGQPFSIQLPTLEYSWKALESQTEASSLICLLTAHSLLFLLGSMLTQAVDDVEPAQPWMLHYGLLLWTIYPILAFHP